LKKIIKYTSLPASLHVRENWNLATGARGITAAELEGMKKTAGYIYYKKIRYCKG
jgi:hypothetical protein